MAAKAGLDNLVPVAQYRLISLAVFGVTGFICLILIWLGPSIHEWRALRGPLKEGKAEALRVFTTNFVLPVVTVAGVFAGVKGWQAGRRDKVFRWQALAATSVFIATCVLTLVVLVYSYAFAHWEADVTDHGKVIGKVPLTQPAEHLENFFSYCGSCFLSVSLAFGVLTSEQSSRRKPASN